jgi:hypothetical protein
MVAPRNGCLTVLTNGAPMAPQRTDPYRYLTCGGCGRSVDHREHWGFPNESTEPTRVHLIADAAAPAYGVLCPCGHYTLYANPRKLPVGLPKGTVNGGRYGR